MLTYITPLYIIKTLGITGILIAIFFENSLVIGGILPGDTLMILIGLVLAQGKILPLGIVSTSILIWIVGVVGSILGYQCGYYIKKNVNLERKTRWYNPKILNTTKEYFDKHGRYAIILSKFTPYVRSTLPMVSGIIGYPFKKYIIDSCIGMAALIIVMIGGSHTIGQVFPSLKDHLDIISLAILCIAICPFLRQLLMFTRKK